MLDTEQSGDAAAGSVTRNGFADGEDEDDGDLSDPPPMEYDADMDREIDEDPDNSDAGDLGDPDEVGMRQLSAGVT